MKVSNTVLIGIAGIGMGILIFAFASKPKEKIDENKWKTGRVTRKDISTEVLATGIIKPQVGAEVRIGSRASGTVTDLYVNIGDYVQKGQLLAELDDAELIAKRNQAKANLNNSEINLKYAEIEFQRIRNLKQKDFVSQQLLDDAKKACEMSKARVQQDRANLEYAEIQQGYSKIYASIPGVIGLVSTQKGETVSATLSAPTFVTIIDLESLEVWAYVDETDIGRIVEGQDATFTVDTYLDHDFIGKVTAVYPQAEIQNNVVNYIVIVKIQAREGKILRPEMTASVKIATQNRENVLTVPNKAIKRTDDYSFVYVLQNGQAVKRKIEVGLRGKYFCEITKGLKEKEEVILNN